MSEILFRSARVIDPRSGTDTVCDVAVARGRIAGIGKKLSTLPAARVVECGGLVLTPGLIDPHVHLREPGHTHKETIATGTLAAAAGGFTTVCCMPNTNPALDTPEMLAFIAHRAKEEGACRVFPIAAATKGRRGDDLAEIALLARAGAVAFSDDGDCVPTPGAMLRVLHAVKQTGKCFMQHCQEPTLTRGAVMHAGHLAMRLGLLGWPRLAEEIIIERDVRLVKESGAAYHAQHVSSGGSVPILRSARAAGLPVTAEATPHHLVLTCDVCDHFNAQGKVNPPVREQRDIDALREAIAEGVITILATDHAPHTSEEKALPFEEAPFGFVGLESALPLYIEALVTPGVISWRKLIEMLTTAPAALCGLDAFGLGALSEGGPADITLIDPEHAWTLSRETLAGKSCNTPFLGRKLKGRAVMTVVGGAVKHDLLAQQ